MTYLFILEVIGAITGLACVYLAARENLWTYPVGVINIVTFIFMFKETQLFADMTLQFIFLLLTIYGLCIWATGPKNTKLVRKTRHLTQKEWLLTALFILIFTPLMGYFYATFSFYLFGKEAVLPFADSFILVTSICAQYFLSKKVIENWYLWLLVDAVAIPLYFSRGLTITSILYVFFFINACYGYLQWRKLMKKRLSRIYTTHSA